MARRKADKRPAGTGRKRLRLGSARLWRGVAIVAVLVAGVGLLVGAGLQLLEPGSVPIREVRVKGALAHTQPAQLKAAVRPHVQAGFFGVDVAAVRRAVEARPWVRRVSVRRVWPDTLELHITEREAVARWGADAAVDRRGQVFHPPLDTLSEGLPRLQGPEGSASALMARREAFRERLAPLGLSIAALVEDERRAWQLVLANGIEVRLGRRGVGQRLERLVRVWPGHLAERAERISRIDLRYTNGLAVAWRDGAS